MMVPSGNGSCPSREALIATSLPRMARRSLSLPSSWATEIKLHSRYPEGILIPEIGAASPSACPDAGAMSATTPASAPTAASTKTIRLIRCLLQICPIEPLRNPAITDQGSEQASSQAIPNQPGRPRLAERSERRSELGTEELGFLPRGEVSALVDLVEVDQVAIGAPGPCLRGSVDVVRKYRDGHRQRDLGGLLRARTNDAASRTVLPVQPPRRGCAIRQPIERNVVQHVVFGR